MGKQLTYSKFCIHSMDKDHINKTFCLTIVGGKSNKRKQVSISKAHFRRFRNLWKITCHAWIVLFIRNFSKRIWETRSVLKFNIIQLYFTILKSKCKNCINKINSVNDIEICAKRNGRPGSESSRAEHFRCAECHGSASGAIWRPFPPFQNENT